MAGTYVDSSALVKLAIEEPQSAALRRYLQRRRPLVASALARTEMSRALLDEGEAGIARGRAVLGRVNLVRVNDRILHVAGTLLPSDVRSLDAIHLATALELGHDVRQIVTYDEQMAEAARALGLRTVAPG
jgi:predicted nucleic acid-binding protein